MRTQGRNVRCLEAKLRWAKYKLDLARRRLETVINDEQLITRLAEGRAWDAATRVRVASSRLALEKAIREYQRLEQCLRRARAQ